MEEKRNHNFTPASSALPNHPEVVPARAAVRGFFVTGGAHVCSGAQGGAEFIFDYPVEVIAGDDILVESPVEPDWQSLAPRGLRQAQGSAGAPTQTAPPETQAPAA